MKNSKKYRIILIIAAILVLAMIVTIIMTSGRKETDKVTVGFIMSGSMEESGWNGLHYQGIKKACTELQAELIVKENVKESSGQCEQAITELAEQDVQMIILSSYGYSKEVAETVRKYPDITFYSESFEHEDSNINSYFARAYQARYMAGIVAGMQTKSNHIGYVAAMANSEVNRGMNAFTLGVKRVNPDANVIVAWSNSWDDEAKEKELANQLIDEKKVDVITYHQNQPNVVEVAEERGIASIGYHEALEGVSANFLTSVVFHWDLIYMELLKDYLRGNSDVVGRYWIGIDKDAVGLSEFSEKVSAETREEVASARTEMIKGIDVFSGKIFDNKGKIRSNAGENISDDSLLKYFDWYVEGVEFYGE